MSTSAERAERERIERENLITQNRAKFTRNRIVYVTPNGMHTAHDVEDAGLQNLVDQLRESGFEARATWARENFMTTDWFKHGEKDFWESYVITRA